MDGRVILCIGPTPAAQRVMVFSQLTLDSVNRAHQTIDGVAGKAVNVAKVLQVLGEQPVLLGFLGGERGEQLRRLLAARGLELGFVTVAAPTRQCITVIDGQAHSVTELVEESLPVETNDYAELRRLIQERIARARAAIMSGTLTPGGPENFYWDCVRLANQAGALSVVDAKGSALIEALKARPGLVKPNRAELAMTVGTEFPDERSLLAGMRTLHEQGAQRVVITAGKEPTRAFDGQRFWRIGAPSIQPVNPIGSGDAFTAALVWRLVRGDDLGEACRWASAAGAANALSWMAGELEYTDITRLLPEVKAERIG